MVLSAAALAVGKTRPHRQRLGKAEARGREKQVVVSCFWHSRPSRLRLHR